VKLLEIVRFELAYQLRRLATWLFLGVVALVAFVMVRDNYLSDARDGAYFLNGPFVVAVVTVIGTLVWLLVAAAVAGDAAARDVHTRMHPLTHTVPVRRAEYLGGRFLAAFAVNALVLLGVPAGILLALHAPGMDAAVLGPPRPAAYLTAYAFVALPNAFVGTAVQFSLAARSGRSQAAYLGSFLLFLAAYVVAPVLSRENWALARLVDPVGVIGILSELPEGWTPLEKSTRLLELQGALLANRLLWVGIALGMLALTHRRFRFAPPAAAPRRVRAARPAPAASGPALVPVRRVPRGFGPANHARQALSIAWMSFRQIAAGRSGAVLLGVLALLLVLTVPQNLEHMGVPLAPRTDHLIRVLTAPLTRFSPPWMIIPLLTVFWAGELVWREREAGLGEITGAAPVPEAILFLGRFLGLGLLLAALLGLLMGVGLAVQGLAGDGDLGVGSYLRVFFVLQLADYLLFALLALVVHVVVDHKALGHLAGLAAYAAIGTASLLGVEDNLLVYGSDPGWSYGDMRGFGSFPGPWLWFKLYWAAWALLLAVAARLLWVRGRGGGAGARLRLARRRLTRRTAGSAAAGAGLVLALGGFIFYNTNVINGDATAAGASARRAEYERRYGRYEGIPQPRPAAIRLAVEIHPAAGAVEIRGAYRLVNRGAVPIDSVHVATVPGVETDSVAFDRPAAAVLVDANLGHRIYALRAPLPPGGSLRMTFRVRVRPRGFLNRAGDVSVAANGTAFSSHQWLPAIGYQRGRALRDPGRRRAHGLPPRPALPPLTDEAARRDLTGAERIDFEAVVGTDADQVAIAPGVLRGTWTRGGRRYFRYATDAAIDSEYSLYSARYALRRASWNGVEIQVFHHPGHGANVDRVIRAVQASLRHYTRRFGPYPYGYLRFVEEPGPGMGMSADAGVISFGEGFSLLRPEGDPRELDLVFAVVAHEVAHQWWGTRLAPAQVEGAPLLTEALATYSALGVVEETFGPEYLRRHLAWLREAYATPRARASVPLLRAGDDPLLGYRRGPLALYALSRYVGEARVDEALRRFFQDHAGGAPPLPTSLDLYRELRAVTPDAQKCLLSDLFESNTFWDVVIESATAAPAGGGAWRVTLRVRARKTTVDTAGVETVVPMDDRFQFGVFAPAEAGAAEGRPLYLRMHRVRSGRQTITLTVPVTPARAGIDPYHLLTDSDSDDKLLNITLNR